MPTERPLAFQLGKFFESTTPKSAFGSRSEYGFENDRALYAIGNPYGPHIKFYDYTETHMGAESDPDKSQYLNWTLKHYLDHATKTPPGSTPAEVIGIFTASLGTIFELDRTLDLSKALLVVDNEVVLRGQDQQLRFTFLAGGTLHGHAYFEPLNAPVQVA